MDIERLKVDREYWDSVAPDGYCMAAVHGIGFQWLRNMEMPTNLNSEIIPRPEPRQVEWDGEGLPPVGWRGELKGSLDDCEIVCEWRGGRVYYNEFTEQFAWTDSGRVFSAKEQREREELKRIIADSEHYGHDYVTDAIIAAGWRKDP